MKNTDVGKAVENYRNQRSQESVQAVIESVRDSIDYYINKHRVSGSMSAAALRTEAEVIVINQLKKFTGRPQDFKTFVSSHLQGLSRINRENSLIPQPENRYQGMPGFVNAINELRDRNDGIAPSAGEIADFTGISMAEVSRYQKDNMPTVGYGNLQYDPNVLGVDLNSGDKYLIYVDLGPVQQKVFEHLVGYNGKPQLPGIKEIAAATGLSVSAVTKARDKIRDKIKEYMD